MLKNHLKQLLVNNLGHEPTKGQFLLLERLAAYILGQNNDKILIIKGYAGTGKTTIISSLVKTLRKYKYNTILLAPTGRAAKVMSAFAAMPAYTIHKKIYRQANASDGFGHFKLDRNLHKQAVFIIDEASMIANESPDGSVFGSGRLLDDLMDYVRSGNNCRIIFVGDTAQLPPVGLTISPALDKNFMKRFANEVEEAFLDEVIRQQHESGILQNATSIRKQITANKNGFLKLVEKDFADVECVNGNELVECISENYDRYGMRSTIVITRSNKRANLFNQGIRNQILWREEEISEGDYLMVVKNNYFWLAEYEELDFIANGDIIQINRIHGFKELYGFRFADITASLVDYEGIDFNAKIIVDTIHSQTASMGMADNKKFYYAVSEDYPEIKNKRSKYLKIRENEYFNALQVKFAYAVTCHKAQGGQWKAVFIDQGYLKEDMIDTEYLRWLYTAFTRATEKIYLVNFSEKFFE